MSYQDTRYGGGLCFLQSCSRCILRLQLTLPKSICPKMKVKAWLVFKLAYFEVSIQHIINYSTVSSRLWSWRPGNRYVQRGYSCPKHAAWSNQFSRPVSEREYHHHHHDAISNGYPWASLAAPPSSIASGSYIPYLYRAAVCRFELVALPLLDYV